MGRGSITEVFRPCGKPTCACAAADHPGHGPYYAFTTKVDGKTKTLPLRPGPMLSKSEREVETHRGFRATCDRLLAVNEAFCAAPDKSRHQGWKENSGARRRARGRSRRRDRRRPGRPS
jgi:hypothetical protein